ncbi:hypothetical protein [Methyloversatilis sp.]|uniref:hypothetical protein n=1 Tax=Methyloversatilis sp. TaxID=2569862 RepID=UPI0027332D36|nr:hypothetical protein [Methyloversatilis sp.]MDP2870678.1 hypothetical protein [Methyloversatilis sp.]MDP3457530.1 hypothetical protein [Methyloversatilis sp.]MDP3577093.1 hypothetical protein [Methyloversatilis sp.]
MHLKPSDPARGSAFPCAYLLILAALLGGCAATRSPPITEVTDPAPASPEVVVNPVEPSPLQQAMKAAHPRTGNVARAKALLETLLATTDDASRAQHPYARSLLDQINERQRLVQQAERTSQQLKDSQLRNDELQRKIDALADIERMPPVRTPKRALAR